MKRVKKYISLFIIVSCLFTIFDSTVVFSAKNNKIVTYQGSGKDGVKTKSIPLKNQNYVYTELINAGYSEACAYGIIGNLIQESGINPKADSGTGYKGIMQWGSSRWKNAETRVGSKKRETLEGQVENMLKEIKEYKGSFNVKYEGQEWSLKKFKKCKNSKIACDIFCVVMEGCVGDGGSGMSAVETYQQIDYRRQWTYRVEENLSGKSFEDILASVGSDTSTAAQSAQENQAKDTAGILGSEAADYIADQYNKHTLSDYKAESSSMDGLTAEERVKVGEIQNIVNNDESIETVVIRNVRTAFMLIGILIVVYSLVLFLAFWFDSYNPFFEMSFLSLVSFGKYYAQTEIGEHGVEGKKALSLKNIVVLLAMGTFFSVFILSGEAFAFIDFIFTKLQMLG